MELPPGPFSFIPPSTVNPNGFAFNPPQQPAVNPTQFAPFAQQAQSPLSGGHKDGDRAKLRRVVVREDRETQRIPKPFESEETRIIRQYEEFKRQYPTLGEQLAALPLTLNHEDIRNEIIFGLIEERKIREAFPFIMGLQNVMEKERLLYLLIPNLAALDAVQEIQAIFAFAAVQPNAHLKVEALKLSIAKVYLEKAEISEQVLNRVLEIYTHFTIPENKRFILSKLHEIMIFPYIALNKIPEAIQLIKFRLQPIQNQMLLLMGRTLLEQNKMQLVPYILQEMAPSEERNILENIYNITIQNI